MLVVVSVVWVLLCLTSRCKCFFFLFLVFFFFLLCCVFFFQAEDGIRYLVRSRGLGDVYKRQVYDMTMRKNASSLGEHIRAENGIARAVTIIEQNRHPK